MGKAIVWGINMWALFLLAGASLLLFIPDILPSAVLLVMLMFGFSLWVILAWTSPKKQYYTKYLCAFIFGFAYASLSASFMQDTVISSEYEGKDIHVSGVIDSVPQLKTYTTSKGKLVSNMKFIMLVEHAKDGYGNQIENLNKIKLSWYSSHQQLTAGQRWKLIVRLKKPVGFANFGGFDYERTLFSKRIGATGYVTKRYKSELLPGTTIEAWNDILRERVITKLKATLPDHELNGIILALATGYRSDINSEQWNTLLISGTNHLVAISGLHIGLIAGISFFICKFVWYLSPRLRIRVAPIKVGACGAIIAAVIYSALAGFSIPTQRALLMVTLLMCAILFKRYTRPEQVLAVALAVILLIDPLAVLMPGFWLSFAAVLIIIFAICKFKLAGGWKRGVLQWIYIQCAISIGLAPLTLLFFERVSLISPLVNLIAVPLFSSLIVPLVFIAMVLLFLCPQLSTLLFIGIQWSLEKFWLLIEYFSGFEMATFSCSKMAVIAFTCSFIVLVVSAYYKKWKIILLIPLLLIPYLLSGPSLGTGEFEIDFLDVGQGTAIVVKTANYNLLYDTGPNRGLDAGESVVVPYLKASGISKLDKLVVSHADNDHAGGAKAVIDAVNIEHITVGEQLENIKVPSSACRQGKKWKRDGVEFSFIYPFGSKTGKTKSGNDASCVLFIKSEYGSLLLTGDITKSVERKLIKHYNDDQLNIDIVSVPHHGSKGSSSKEFVAAISPEYAVVSSGYRNRYKFPKPAVVRTYINIGAKIINTADSGMITIHVGEKGISKPSQYRLDNHRVWMAVQPDS